MGELSPQQDAAQQCAPHESEALSEFDANAELRSTRVGAKLDHHFACNRHDASRLGIVARVKPALRGTEDVRHLYRVSVGISAGTVAGSARGATRGKHIAQRHRAAGAQRDADKRDGKHAPPRLRQLLRAAVCRDPALREREEERR